MGELFRRFWLPFAMASELPGADCVPVRVRLLGEDLIAFRDSSGRPGLVDAYCPHRGAPLFFGRNEEDGLRCVYHGWKFDVSGACVDLPNAPEGETFKQKVRVTAYPCRDAGDVLWAYLGPPEREPPFPEFEWMQLPATHRFVSKFEMECNYLQSMEGDYDPSHAAFLHMNLAERAQEFIPTADLNMNNTSAGMWLLDQDGWGKLEDSDSGVLCVTAIDQPDGRVAASACGMWMMPIFCTAGIGGTALHSGNFRVPIDNENLMFFRLRWSYGPIPAPDMDEYRSGGYFYPELTPGTNRSKANVHNDYEVDRVAQRNFSFSGIKSFPLQDIAMMENQWGRIADRTQEHLTSADQYITYIRRRLLRAARAMADGAEPSEPWHPEAYRYHYGFAFGESREEAIAKAKSEATSSQVEKGAAR